MVFCRTRDRANQIAALLELEAYHSLTPEADRDRIFKHWVQGKTQVIVTTSILSAGVDQRVRDTVIIDQPWDWINDFQAGNRAGRNGMRARVVYYLPDNLQPTPYNAAKPFGADLFVQWAYDVIECRRLGMSLFNDGAGVTCLTLEGARLCDNCSLNVTDISHHPPTLPIPTPRALQTAPVSSMPTVPVASLIIASVKRSQELEALGSVSAPVMGSHIA
jgi:hypothetical protein